jgi:hypothetical protein
MKKSKYKKINTILDKIIQYFVDFTRGGVFGRGLFICAIFCYTGFNIWKEHIKFSSTLIKDPELLN